MAIILGSQEAGFAQLNEYFLDAFVVEGHQLHKYQAELYLELKTQAYLAALRHGADRLEVSTFLSKVSRFRQAFKHDQGCLSHQETCFNPV